MTPPPVPDDSGLAPSMYVGGAWGAVPGIAVVPAIEDILAHVAGSTANDADVAVAAAKAAFTGSTAICASRWPV